MSKNIFTRATIPVEWREKIHKRFGGICYLCGKTVSLKNMHADHIVAVAQGGPTNLSNLAPTHPACNLKKGKRNLTKL